MGEAKRRAAKRAVDEAFSKPMKQARFDLFALGTRLSMARLMSDERSYWSDHEERVLGLVFRDTVDDDYGWILLAIRLAGFEVSTSPPLSVVRNTLLRDYASVLQKLSSMPISSPLVTKKMKRTIRPTF